MNYINLTPHKIVLNDGRSFEPSGEVARVDVSYSTVEDDIAKQIYGDVFGLPAPAENTRYIVSGLVLSAVGSSRKDVVAPATGHPDVVRSDKGFIASVPCFTQPE